MLWSRDAMVLRPCSGLAMGEGPVVPVGEGRVVKFSPSTYIVGLISVKYARHTWGQIIRLSYRSRLAMLRTPIVWQPSAVISEQKPSFCLYVTCILL